MWYVQLATAVLKDIGAGIQQKKSLQKQEAGLKKQFKSDMEDMEEHRIDTLKEQKQQRELMDMKTEMSEKQSASKRAQAQDSLSEYQGAFKRQAIEGFGSDYDKKRERDIVETERKKERWGL